MHRCLSSLRVLSAGLAALALGCFVPSARAQTNAFNDTFTGGSTVNSTATAPTSTKAAYQQLASKNFSPNPPVLTAGNLRSGIVSTSSGFSHVQALFTNYPVTLVNNGDYIELTVNFSQESGILTAANNSTLFFGLYNAGQVQPLSGGMNGTIGTIAPAGSAQNWVGYVNRILGPGGAHGFFSRPAQTVANNNQDLMFQYPVGNSGNAIGSTATSTLAAFATNAPYTEVYRITRASATTLTLKSSIYAGATATGSPLYTQTVTSASALTMVYDAFAIGHRCVSSQVSVMNITAVKITTTGTTTIKPEILTQPLGQTKTVGDPVSLSVVADGGPGTVLAYQWKKNGADIGGAISATYAIPGAALGDAGDYTVVITDAAGSTTSAVATLTVFAGAVAPTIVVDPVGNTIAVGGTHTFSPTVNGTPPLSYQWQKSADGVAAYTDLGGATAATYAITGATLADAGFYRVVVTNAQGSATSAGASLVVTQVPAITAQPVGAVLAPGAALNLSVSATGSPAPTFQWRKNGVVIAGATASSYAVASVTGADTGGYTVVVSNAVGSVTSATAAVAVVSASMAQTAVTPLSTATGLNPDTRLTITFNEAVTPGTAGLLRIYDASDDSVVDTIDLAAATALRDTLRAASSLSTQLLPVQTKPIGGIATNFNYYPITVSGNTATLYPRNGVLAYNKTYYVKVDAGVFANASGEVFAGIADATTWRFTTKAAGPAAGTTSLTVAADGSGDFTTVQAALDFIPAGNTTPTTIRLKAGTYFEEVGFQSKHFVTLVGDDVDGVVLAYPNNNTFNNVSGVYHRATLVAQSVHDFTVTNLTIRNTTPQNGSQAEAIVINGSSATSGRNLVTHCKFFSYQDTVQFNKQTYVSDSVIEGDVDFMWGDGPTFFENCDIRILRTAGYFTQVRNTGGNHGFVFHNCRFTAPAGVTGTYFGRIDPAGFPSSEVVILDSSVGDAANNSLLATATGASGANYAAGWWLLNNAASAAAAPSVHNWANALLDGTGAALASPNADAFTTMPADATLQANYRDAAWVLNTNIAGTAGGSWTPSLAPVFTLQPVSQTASVGAPVTFSAAVSAIPAATYQWKKDGVDLAGATAATYAIGSTVAGDAGAYTVVATNSAGSTTSAAAVLSLIGPPAFTTQPLSQAVMAGADVTFTAAATGTAPISYQWKKNGADLAGATAATLSLPNVQPADAGTYTVVATNPGGSTPSSAATLTVLTAPAAPVSTAATGVTAAGFTANWNAAAGATGYRLDVATDAAFGSFVSGYQNLDAGAGLSANVSGLSAGTTYYYRVRAFNGLTSVSSATISVTTQAAVVPDLVNDTFSDTDRIGGTDGSTSTSSAPLVSTPTATNTQWVANRAKQLVASATGMQWTFDTTSNVQAQGYFPSVTVGSTPVTFTLSFTTGASGGTANNLRIALVDDTAGGRRTTDGFASTDGTTVGDVGYALLSGGSNIGGGNTTNLSFGTFRRVVTSSNGLLGTAGDWGSALASSAGATGYFQPNTPYALQLTLTSTAGGLTVRTVLTGGNFTGLDYTATDAASPVLTFNSLAVRFGAGSNQFNGIRFTGLRITTASSTPPSAPVITAQPSGQTVIEGANAVFTVAATGSPAPVYQWRRNGGALANGGRVSGATTATLAVTGALAADAGDYSVVVSNAGGSVTSSAATLTVQTPPAITTPPASQSVLAGADVSFTVAASGTAPLGYQWKRNGADLAGATAATLNLPAVTLADAGDYTVVVSNVAGSATSPAATLAVSAAVVPPAIVTPPASQSVTLGAAANFTVVASGTAPLGYQWSKDGVALPGATAASLSLASVTAADAGSYTVTVSNSAGSVTSDPAGLTVNLPPTITAQPAGATAEIGSSVSFTVGVTGTAPFAYQWKKDGNAIGGATGSSYTLASVIAADAGSYTVVVTNAVGSATSSAAVLAVNTPPSITTQPTAQVALAGGNATFVVAAAGTAPLSYQWSKDGAALTGATSATLALTAVQAADAGSYAVTVTNPFGSVTSNPAALTLGAALPNSAYNLTGFATVGAGTTGGGVIPETDPAYRKAATPLEFVQAIADSNKTAGLVKVIEITADLNLGWNEVGATVRAVASNPLRSHAAPKLHPTLIASGVSVLDIKAKSGLTIFSANGSTIKHVNFNVKGTSNIIIRNLRFDEMWEWDEASKGDYDSNDWDFITLSNGGDATNIWIDHCTFTKGYDGVTDMKAGTQYVTLSWCRYLGDDGATNPGSPVRVQLAALEANKSSYAFYNFLRTNGFSLEDIATVIQGHDKGHLLGSNSLDSGNATLSATFHHQWLQNVWDRAVPRLRAGNVHNYNIYVDDTGALAAKRLRDTRAAALTTALRNTLNNTYSFNPPLNGSISTEGGALLLEKSVYSDCVTPLRNNQTDVTNPAYTGKILGLDSIYSFHNADGTTTVVRGNSTDAGNPMGPFQAAIIPFSWNLAGNVLPYAYTMDDPAQLGDILAIGAGAGRVTWSKENWLKTSYVDDAVAPVILTQPASQTVAAGASATFTVVATGSGNAYQWRKAGVDLPGATGVSLALANVQAADAGDYTVVVTNAVGSVTSAVATLTVTATAPVIVTPPAAQTASVGGSASFTVVATGTAPLAYQWTKDGTDVAGATAATLALTNLSAADAGSYAVVVTNSAGSTTSASAALTVVAAPVITGQPASQSAAVGASVSFTVTATGTAPLGYQWAKDGANIAGATTATLTLNNVQATDAAGYTVTVSNAAGSVTSAAATLAVSSAPAILAQPASQSVVVGANVDFTVVASGSGNGYQWRKDGTDLPGATSATLTLVNVQVADAGGYAVTVTNAFGSVLSATATLAVSAPGAGDLYVAPNGLAGNPGTLAAPTTLAAAVTLVPPGSVIWMRGGTYALSAGVTVAIGNNGEAGAPKSIFAYQGETPVLDFSAQAVSSANRGLTLNGNYWQVRGLVVEHAGDNGIYIGGHHNIVQRCITRFNADSGLQLGRAATAYTDLAQWPSYNLILDCESHDNKDATNENADGFACKLTTGVGNVFRGCVAHNNIDDGWDLFTKGDTGPIGGVTIDQCIAYNNGVLSDGSSSGAGDKNGFKLGGEDIAVIHVVTRSIAFGNGKNGFTWNSNPGAIRLINNLAFNNTQGNFKFDQAGPVFLNNISLWTTGTGVNDRYGGSSGIATGPSNVFWFASGTPRSRNDQGIQVSAASFVTLAVPAGGFARSADGSLALGGFGRPVDGSPLVNAGSLPSAAIIAELSYDPAAYYEGAPDIGVVEYSTVPVPAAILTQPAGLTVTAGAAASFSVAATGSGTLDYQWSKDGTAIPGATAATYTIAATTAADAGSYTVTVSNGLGSVTSSPAVLAVNAVVVTAPVITTQPLAASVVTGAPASFSVVATGTAPLAYQWAKGGSDIPGATSATYAIAATTAADAGSYTVTVGNAAGSVTSNAVLLTVTTPTPTDTSYLADTFNDGSRTNLAPTTSAAWFTSGGTVFTNGTGGANGSLALDNGSSRTLIGYFTLAGAPVSVGLGDSLTLDITFTIDGAPISKASGLIVGLLRGDANGAAVAGTGFTPAGSPNTNGRVNADFASSNPTSHVFGSYVGYAAWTNLIGASNPVTLRKRIVTAAPGTDGLDNASASWTQIGSAGGTGSAPATGTAFHAVLKLTRTAANAMTINYQLTQGGSTLVNHTVTEAAATTTSFDTINVYMASGTLTGDAAAHLTLKQANVVLSPSAPAAVAPAITTHPVAQSALVGGSASFTVAASGTAPLSYQWSKDGAPLAGATAATLSLANVQLADAGSYTVKVTNAAGFATSNAAGLTVSQPVAIVTPPQPQTVTVGAIANFSVTATGYPAPTYQWQKNGAALAGATAATLAVGPVLVGDAGDYSVVVTNPLGSVTSTAAALTVNKAAASVALTNLSYVYDGTPKAALAAPTPAGLSVIVTYNGSPVAPSAAGSYAVIALIDDASYSGSATGTLTIAPMAATITVASADRVYDGAPKPLVVTTDPSDAVVSVTYNGSPTVPTYPGTYAVVATATGNHQGSASATLKIRSTVLVRHAPVISGTLEGSVQQLLAENVTLGGTSTVTGDLLVPGTPSVAVGGSALLGATLDGPGAAAPAGYSVALNTNAVVRSVVRRIDPVAMPVVTAPPAPTGTRTVSLTAAGQSAGDFTTLRNLSVTGNAGMVAVPAGTYGTFTLGGATNGVILGVAGATEPAVYNLQGLTASLVPGAGAKIQVVGPVIINLASGVTINGLTGSAAHPEWLVLRIANGGLTISTTNVLHGSVVAPNGTVSLNNTAAINGTVVSDKLSINGASVLNDPEL